MQERTLEDILKEVARKHHTTPEIVRKEMEITLEAFIEYVAMVVKSIS